MVWLEVPFSSLPGEQSKIDTKLANGKNYGFIANNQQIVANKAWAEQNPAAAKLFEIIKLPVGDINAPAGEVTQAIRRELTEIQYGRAPDRHGWMVRLR